jgi:ABC-type transport system involved in cytochrome bd biosynthesis fused ATPase/permease subunit
MIDQQPDPVNYQGISQLARFKRKTTSIITHDMVQALTHDRINILKDGTNLRWKNNIMKES